MNVHRLYDLKLTSPPTTSLVMESGLMMAEGRALEKKDECRSVI